MHSGTVTITNNVFFLGKGRPHSLAAKIRHSKQSAIKMHFVVCTTICETDHTHTHTTYEMVSSLHRKLRAFTFKVIPMCTFTTADVRPVMHLIQFLSTYRVAPNMCEPETQLANVRETRHTLLVLPLKSNKEIKTGLQG